MRSTLERGAAWLLAALLVGAAGGAGAQDDTAPNILILQSLDSQTVPYVTITQIFRARLQEQVLRLIYGDDPDGDGIPDTPESGTAFGQDDYEFNVFNTDRQLSALQTAMSMLRPLPEKKALVYFSTGLRLNGTDNHAQLRATTNAALRANVSIHAIDARGLVAQAPLGDASRPSPGGMPISISRSATSGFSPFAAARSSAAACTIVPASASATSPTGSR